MNSAAAIRADQRAGRAGGYQDVRAPGDFEHTQRVARGLLDLRVAVHRRHPDDFQFRRAEREQQRHRVVHAGVGVEQDFAGHVGPSWPEL